MQWPVNCNLYILVVLCLSSIRNMSYNYMYDPLKQVRVYLILEVFQNDSLLENIAACAWLSEAICSAVLKRSSTEIEDGSSVICRWPQ